MNTHIQTLADAGAHFVLCTSDKRPRKGVKWKDVRPSAGETDAWLKKNKTNLAAVVPGSLRLIVVDIDKHIEEARKVVIESAGSPLAEAKTRKGKHLFYPKVAARTRNGQWEYGDTRQDDGYAIMWDMKAVVEANNKLPGDPFDPTVLPRKQTAPPGEITGAEETAGRNNRLWADTFRAGLIGDDKARANAEKWTKVNGLSDKEIEITSKKGWATGHAARINKILPSMDATCFEAALTLKGIDYRFNTRSMSPEINVPDQDGFMSGWKHVDYMKEARMFGDIAREIKLYKGPNMKDKPFDVPLPKRKVFTRISQVSSIFSAARRRFCYKNHEVVAYMERRIWHTRWVNRNRGAFGSFLTVY